MAAVMVGSISCPLNFVEGYISTEKRKRTIMVPETIWKTVCTPIEVESTQGCCASCAGLRKYSKTSLARAVREGDLTRAMRCPTCGLLARVGEARDHIVKRQVSEFKRVSETIMVEKTIEVNEAVLDLPPVMEQAVVRRFQPSHASISPAVVAPPPFRSKSVLAMNKECDKLMKEREKKAEEIFQAFFSKPEMADSLQRKKFGKIVRTGNGLKIAPASNEQVACKINEIREMNKLERMFYAGELEEFSQVGKVMITDCTIRGEQVSFASPFYTRTLKTKKRKQQEDNRLKLPSNHIEMITKELCKIVREGRSIEFIHKRKEHMKASYKRLKGNMIACVSLAHMKGIKVARELKPRAFDHELKLLMKYNQIQYALKNSDVVRGFSGAILPLRIVGYTSRNFDNFVVRGRCDGKLIDARCKISYHMRHRMEHYAEKEFWTGWKKVFDKTAPTIDHACVSDLTNEQCGELAAGIFQRVHPCKRISCLACRRVIEDLDRDDYFEFINKNSKMNNAFFWKVGNQYASANVVLNNIDQTMHVNPEIDTLMEITRILQGHSASQMQHLVNIQTALIKGTVATSEDLSMATKSLLEIARWFKNHLSQMEKGDLAVFRNKASSKTSINFSLLCDNQLDRNGNFVWGERGRHSKRFFSNFFEEVVPGDGYVNLIERKHPNGVRKLAIGHLVVPLDLDRVRNALEGDQVDLKPVSQACISKSQQSFEYTCCCVTNDKGNPFYSSIKSPTKSHLVIGNTGDAKYVDLPTFETERMYVAKEGYCYVNIFLAMLVNVNEESAKDFTKRVRDVFIPMLGKWPTMYDLAAVCYILTIFHPETRNAELPRILVDHDNQMMHVIDSFGSLNTGYHVLKAGTIQQLLPFARKSLEGEMKHYRVGGSFDKIRLNRMETMLIKSIYRPKAMIRIIEDDPYVLFLCLVTPKLITALYNTGGLDRAMEHWVDRNTSLSTAFAMLAYLAKKVSRADFIKEQVSSISSIAQKLSDLLQTEGVQALSRNEVMMFIESMASRSLVDEQMVRNGFVSFEASLLNTREKIYAQRLASAWRELSLLEKLYAMKSFYFRRKDTIDVLIEPDTSKVEAKYEISCTWFYKKIQGAQSGVKRYVQEKVSACSDYARRTFIQRISQIINKCFSDVFYMINVLLLISMFTSIITFVKQYFDKAKEAKWNIAFSENRCKMHEIESMYSLYVKAHGVPTEKEFYRHMYEFRPDLCDHLDKMYNEVEMQSKTYLEHNFERIIAFMALITMMFDEKKSDVVFKVLNKIKTVFNSFGDVVRLQGVDEIESIEDEKKETVDFLLRTEELSSFGLAGSRFEDWWRNQLEQNRVVTHYRLTGTFLEFTRETLAQVCNTINTSSEREFLIRGAVGSGKSTGLPNQLCKKGRVLLLEPTRPLAENVCKQLRKEPFYNNATLRMRGLNSFGSSNVTVMTSGFALHYYAHNQAQLENFDFVMIDECHVVDSSAMAFYCLLMEYSYPGKILRVSATPPGRECEFQTQFPVRIKIEEQASFTDFVAAQGTKCNMDVIQDGDNILVYVASYNDVDSLSKQLIDNGFMVTKVDGRTMKLGGVEIVTRGTSASKHFIVATNIIENGVTLDVDVVVDFGLKVQAELDSDLRSMRYSKIPISYGERIQRLGRVGRVKPGTALRIGHTEKGVSEIPVYSATEAAFFCFAYGLPVMSHNVTLSVLSSCSVPQAKTMLNFELPCFFMVDLVSHSGNMHPLIHDELKKFKLRDSAITLNKLAIPNASVNKWISVRDYNRYGVKMRINEDVKIPFHSNNIPDLVYERIWTIVCDNRSDAGFGCLKLANACKIAYTLSIDSTVLPKTVGIIDALIQQEMEKKAHFENMTSALTNHSFSLQGIVDRVRSRYLKDHTGHNIQILQTVRAQIIEFSTKNHDLTKPQHLLPYGFLDVVRLEGSDQVAERLGLKGVWNGGLMTQDVIILLMISIGGVWMIWDYFKSRTQDVVLLQGKRRNQKLKFRDARDRKVGREVYCDDGTMEQTFGEAYSKRGKVKGNNNKRGMGNKTRNFVHLYGFDPTEYSFVRFLDPLTGATIDDTPTADLSLIQEEFGDIRRQAILNDELTKEKLTHSPGIRAYFANPKTHKAIKVDLHPHNPLAVCRNVASIAGFPEREFELRQTGDAKQIAITEIPKEKEAVTLEGKSILRGPRDYNPIARSVCQVMNNAEGHKISMHAIGYGSILIAPGHLFQHTGGTFEVSTYMGLFKVHNANDLKIHHLKGRDLILIRMPKDFPPFPQRLRFRHPIDGEKGCMVSSIFQQKNMSSSVSETTVVMPTEGCHYWKHWISSSEGSCGLPLVSTKDGFILGIHGLGGCVTDKNYFVTIPDNFENEVLNQMDKLEWSGKWRYNIDKILWGRLCYAENEEDSIFKISKYARDLAMVGEDLVKVQGSNGSWIRDELYGNLKAVAEAESHLVTKHVIKGRCEYFTRYLNENNQAREYFQPLMGQYGPSKLNKEAFKKDFFKYTPAIDVGQVDVARFDLSLEAVKNLLIKLDFGECKFVTDSQEILNSLNLKSSVGAMFKGKKKEYLESFDERGRELLVEKSCLRLFLGKMGIWNGSLKAELRHVDKLAMNKTRTFTAAPIDTLLGAKVCVDDFNNRFYSLHSKGPWTVGMTKFYKGWDNFLRSLPEGWIYCHADGSRFDSSLTPYLINAVVILREYFMEDWQIGKEMLRNLYTEVVYTPILTPDGTIVKKFKGNNSGQPSTVVDNTLMVVIAVYYALSKEISDLSACDEFIKFFANGDDLVIAIEPGREYLLDGFATSFGELGLDYDFTERNVDRSKIEFMSHVGLVRDGLYIPKLDKERVVSILEWDRSKEVAHRAEAICAAMIEAWGYDDLLLEIRKFYDWLMNQAEFKDLAARGTFPYISETALRKLYTDQDASTNELALYWEAMMEEDECEFDVVVLQGDKAELDAGASAVRRKEPTTQPSSETSLTPAQQDRDVDTGSRGQVVPRIKLAGRKMRMPKSKSNVVLDLEHLLEYKPDQVDLSNTRATHKQFEMWLKTIQEDLSITDEQMRVVLNGFMVWCIENGTSPNMNGVWTMMDGDEQVEFPLKPFVENARPTLRQIMHHFSDAAEAYIEFRNAERVYIPRYALIRNLRDASLARFAFDFYEMHAKTPIRAREAHLQMKAAALANVSTRMFGLDGNIATQEENTERHVATDVNANMHTLLGVRHT